MRQLLFRNSITASPNANCGEFGKYSTPAFEFRTEKRQAQEIQFEDGNNEINTLIEYLNKKSLSDFQENVLYYISGYIVRSLINNSTCNYCNNIMLFKENIEHDYTVTNHFSKFTNLINWGGLIPASDIVFRIVCFAEKQFRSIVDKQSIFKNYTNIKNKLINTAIIHFSKKIEELVPIHPLNQEFISEDLHEVQIIRSILQIFIKCRMHHYSKLKNIELLGKSAPIRQKMTKLVLFSNC